MMEKERWRQEDGAERRLYEQPARQSAGVIAAGLLLLIAGLFLVAVNLYVDGQVDDIRNRIKEAPTGKETVHSTGAAAAEIYGYYI